MRYVQEPVALERQLQKGRVERGVKEGEVRLEEGKNRLRYRVVGKQPVEAPQLHQIRRAADGDALRHRVHQQQQVHLDRSEGSRLVVLQALQGKGDVVEDPRLEGSRRDHDRVAALEQFVELEHLEQADLVVHVLVHERLDCLARLVDPAVDEARDRAQLFQHVIVSIVV